MEVPLSEIESIPQNGGLLTHIGALFLLVALGAHTLLALFAYLLHYYDTVARRNEKPASALAYLRAFLGEWFFGIGLMIAYLFGFIPPRRPRELLEGGGPPILLVHGYMMNRACMFAIYWGLRRYGFRNGLTMNFWPIVGPIEAAASQVAAKVRAISELAGGAPVYTVTHSLGGLAVRLAVQQDPSLPVAKLVTIATPHHGTQMAHFAIGPAAAQLKPDSSFLATIAGPPRVPLVSIYSRLDHMVFPPSTAQLGERTIQLDELGHLRILLSPRVIEAIAGEIPRKSEIASGAAAARAGGG